RNSFLNTFILNSLNLLIKSDSYIEVVAEKKLPAVFPKPLESFDRKPIVNDLGLTQTEIKSLQNAWNIIKKKQRQAGVTIYINLFSENEQLYEMYRTRNGKLHTEFAAQHQKIVLGVFQMIVEQLENTRFIKTLLKEVSAKHLSVHVSHYHWQLYTNEVKRYFVETLSGHSSPTFVRALDTLMDSVCKFNVTE
ncbi:uncharacterized protein LOC118754221, partial [Rhagoletis pomonella]|uniref:uncharacterized protein LOC118754221 n=1 Tax=Rhagoletis pomonella TaxID=28610 RepID=UPI001781C1AE